MISWGSPLLAKFNFNDSQESQVSALITAVYGGMDRYTGRNLAEKTYDKQLRLMPSGEVHVLAYPITSVQRIYIGWQEAIQITSTQKIVSVTTNFANLFVNYLSGGTITTVTLPYATYATIGALQTAVNAIGGFTFTISGNYSAYPSIDIVAGQVLQSGVPLNIWDSSSINQYTFDESRGIIRIGLPYNWIAFTDVPSNNNAFAPPYFQDRARVIWTGGYNDSGTYPWPQELDMCAADLVGFYFDGQTGIETQVSFDGHFSNQLMFDRNRIPVSCKNILDSYRERNVG